MALNPSDRIFLNFAESCIITCSLKYKDKKDGHRTRFWKKKQEKTWNATNRLGRRRLFSGGRAVFLNLCSHIQNKRKYEKIERVWKVWKYSDETSQSGEALDKMLPFKEARKGFYRARSLLLRVSLGSNLPSKMRALHRKSKKPEMRRAKNISFYFEINSVTYLDFLHAINN